MPRGAPPQAAPPTQPGTVHGGVWGCEACKGPPPLSSTSAWPHKCPVLLWSPGLSLTVAVGTVNWEPPHCKLVPSYWTVALDREGWQPWGWGPGGTSGSVTLHRHPQVTQRVHVGAGSLCPPGVGDLCSAVPLAIFALLRDMTPSSVSPKKGFALLPLGTPWKYIPPPGGDVTL